MDECKRIKHFFTYIVIIVKTKNTECAVEKSIFERPNKIQLNSTACILKVFG